MWPQSPTHKPTKIILLTLCHKCILRPKYDHINVLKYLIIRTLIKHIITATYPNSHTSMEYQSNRHHILYHQLQTLIQILRLLTKSQQTILINPISQSHLTSRTKVQCRYSCRIRHAYKYICQYLSIPQLQYKVTPHIQSLILTLLLLLRFCIHI